MKSYFFTVPYHYLCLISIVQKKTRSFLLFFYIIQNPAKSKAFCIIMEIFVVFKTSMFFSEYNPFWLCQSYTVHSFQFKNIYTVFLLIFFNFFITICRNSKMLFVFRLHCRLSRFGKHELTVNAESRKGQTGLKPFSPSCYFIVFLLCCSYLSFQMSLLYSSIVLSDEKNPAFAMFTSIIFFHFASSL